MSYFPCPSSTIPILFSPNSRTQQKKQNSVKDLAGIDWNSLDATATPVRQRYEHEILSKILPPPPKAETFQYEPEPIPEPIYPEAPERFTLPRFHPFSGGPYHTFFFYFSGVSSRKTLKTVLEDWHLMHHFQEMWKIMLVHIAISFYAGLE